MLLLIFFISLKVSPLVRPSLVTALLPKMRMKIAAIMMSSVGLIFLIKLNILDSTHLTAAKIKRQEVKTRAYFLLKGAVSQEDPSKYSKALVCELNPNMPRWASLGLPLVFQEVILGRPVITDKPGPISTKIDWLAILLQIIITVFKNTLQ